MRNTLTTELIEQGRELLHAVHSLKVALHRLANHHDDFELGSQDLYLDDKLLPAIGNWLGLIEDAVPKHDKPRVRDFLSALDHLPYLHPQSNEIDIEQMRTNLDAVEHHLQAAINLVRKHWVQFVLDTRQTLTELEAAEVLRVSDKTIRNYKRSGKLRKTNTGRITTESVLWQLGIRDD